MLSEPEPLALMNATHDILAEELGHLERNIPDEMARALDENIFLFSGFKTYHEMNDASRLLKDEDGGFKSFDRFLQDVQAIDASYNQNWLYAEYNFATASTQMAAKWADIERDGDEYDLQYRTALDGLVREEHAALEGITLPPSDKFWNEYYPPNGWNCRCTAVQVLKDRYPTSDSDQACAAGERATTQIGKNGENKAEMFRFNPGKAGKVFPPKHPYYKAPAEVKKAVNEAVDQSANPYQEIEQALGVKRGNPMTFDEANELRGNPHYEAGSASGYTTNCQCAVVANELRRRGFDVQALPNIGAKDNIPYKLSRQTEQAWIDPTTGTMPKKTACNKVEYVLKGWKVQRKGQSVKEIAANIDEATKQPGRYHLDFTWKGKEEGHIITVERLEDGKVRLYDPQTGHVKSWAKDYAPRISTIGEVNVLRVDGLMPNAQIIGQVVAKAGTSKSSAPLSATRGGTKGEAKNSLPESVKTRRKEIRSEAKKLTSAPLHHPVFNKETTINGNTIREWTNQPHCNYAEKNEMLLNIEEVFRKSEYLGCGPDKHSSDITAHIFKTKVGNADSWIVVREYPDGNVILHSISDSPNITNWITKNP